ncbi:unnamed protein product [Cunninghamella blakesleeana]
MAKNHYEIAFQININNSQTQVNQTTNNRISFPSSSSSKNPILPSTEKEPNLSPTISQHDVRVPPKILREAINANSDIL